MPITMDDFPSAEESYFEEGKIKGYAEGFAIGFAEGREEGFKKGEWEILASLVKDGLLDTEIAASWLNISVNEFLDRLQKLENEAVPK